MANVNNVGAAAACSNIMDFKMHSSEKTGGYLQLSANDTCPLANKTFAALREINFRENFFPYAVVYIQSKNDGIFCDGPKAIRHLEKSFTNPKTGQTAEKAYLFAQGILPCPFRLVAHSSERLSADMREAGLAFSHETSQEILACRKAFLQKGAFNMHGRDLLPLFERTLEEDPKSQEALLRLGMLYCVGTTTVKNDIPKATAYFSRALAIQPFAAGTIHLVALAYLHGTEGAQYAPKQAKAFLELALRYNPHHIDSLITLGLLYYTGRSGILQNWSHAEKLFSHVLKLDKKNSIAHITLCEMYRIGGFGLDQHKGKSEALFQQVLQEAPQNEEMLQCCTASQLLHGGNGAIQNQDKARSMFEEILKKNPHNQCAEQTLAALRVDANDK
jgi:TPR repeat protein